MKSKLKPRWRRCLKCRRRFQSEGNWNRLCPKCNRDNVGIRELTTTPPRWNGQSMPLRSDVEEMLI